MPTPEPNTLRLLLYWSYANLAMAHAAHTHCADKYGRVHYMIRARLYKGLHTGKMNIGSLLDDERLKMELPRVCAYCGGVHKLTIDHVLPKKFGGWDSADNAVWVCRSCNSSKGPRDVLVWWSTRDVGPVPLLLARRYLKLALIAAEAAGVLDRALEELPVLPFDPAAIPTFFDEPGRRQLWMEPAP